MESKFLLTDESMAVYPHANTRHGHKETRVSKSRFCSSCRHQDSQCCDKTTECLCSACLLCVCCPLAVVWGCVKLPCKIGWHAAKRAKHWACCGSDTRDFASYSSFSDIDSDALPRDTHGGSKPLSDPKKRTTQTANGLGFSRATAGRNSR
ncbi:hypothetical protein I3842_16G083700 [Carya illinoinensis]|uniref:Uncharacterized protein n=1 Tax=Carya illinoinensis TaxID=32201 RepID=A0A922A897_CARIL|nr:hypothetical protein I3842_16G083700 [Carya illinoinensis]